MIVEIESSVPDANVSDTWRSHRGVSITPGGGRPSSRAYVNSTTSYASCLQFDKKKNQRATVLGSMNLAPISPFFVFFISGLGPATAISGNDQRSGAIPAGIGGRAGTGVPGPSHRGHKGAGFLAQNRVDIAYV